MVIHPDAISIHAPRTGSDHRERPKTATKKEISIHAPRTGSDQVLQKGIFRHWISIHAPRTGSDPLPVNDSPFCMRISIHAPRTGSDDVSPIHLRTQIMEFQSTLPARGAT